MPAVALVGAAATVYAAKKGASASKKASKAQQRAADQAAAEQRASEERANAQLAPYREADLGAMRQQQALLGLGGDSNAARAAWDAFRASTGYQSRLDEGTKSVERSAAARGGLNSGATLKALQRYGQDYASNEFGNYFNSLQNLGGQRMGAASQTGQNITGAGQTIGGYLTNAGNARAQAALDRGQYAGQMAQGLGQAAGAAIGAFGGMNSNTYANNPTYLSPIQRETFIPDKTITRY